MSLTRHTRVDSAQRLAPARDRSVLILVVLCSAAFMAMLDVFVVNVAFNSIDAEYPGSSLANLSWVLNAYTIVFAALLIPAGRLADRYGRKAGFIVGLSVFTAARWVIAAVSLLAVLAASGLSPARGDK